MGKIRIEQVLNDILGKEQIKTIVHVGASYGQEVEEYLRRGADRIALVEVLPEVVEKLNQDFGSNPKITVHEALCLDSARDVIFHIAANEGMSSSIFPGINDSMHSVEYVGKMNVTSTTLDKIFPPRKMKHIDLLVIDAQGTDDKVLKGARSVLKRTDFVFVETSTTPLYDGACVMGQVSYVLAKHDFVLHDAYLNDRGTGDSLYKRQGTLDGGDESVSALHGA